MGRSESVKARVACGLLLACLLAAIAGCAACSSGGDGVAARGEGVLVTEDEVDAYTSGFRASAGAEEDAAWERYLAARGLDEKAWREQAIREIAGKRLVMNRAGELGVTADDAQVDRYIEEAKVNRDAAGCDDQTWEAILAEEGTTPAELRGDCEYASVLEQVILADGSFDLAANEDDLQAYVKANLMERVVRRFSVLSFGRDELDEANAAFEELEDLQGAELAQRFDAIAADRQSGAGDLVQGDMGWNITYSLLDTLDGDTVLALQAGELYPQLVERDGGWQIYLCADRFVFEPGTTYDDIQDESLKRSIAQANLYSSWSSMVDAYLAHIVDDAHIEVFVL